MTTIKRAAFLDRDGVINRMWLHAEFGTVDSPAGPEQFELLPGVGEAVAALNRLGLLVIVVSNQPGIGKGKFTPALLAAMERKMVAGIESAGGRLDAVYNCLHHPDAVLDEYRSVCDCRKPQPGLLRQAARDWNVDLARSYMIGDGVTDIAAGCAARATTLFVSSRKCYHCDSLVAQNTWPDYIVSDLSEAALVIHALESGDAERVRPFRLRCAAP
ncbi:MAG TPA: HAD family hydrolase [Blastocatellia bacterium]|nr:HAD family hydrolase [Blastocatellia bacterium]